MCGDLEELEGKKEWDAEMWEYKCSCFEIRVLIGLTAKRFPSEKQIFSLYNNNLSVIK